MKRPDREEYSEYFQHYVSLVGETDIISALQKQMGEINDLFAPISEERGLYAYAAGKMTIKEMLGHLIDGERIFAYRAFRISRGDKTPLSAFDQDLYLANGNYNSIKISELLEEFELLRRSNLGFLSKLDDSMWAHSGTASDSPVTTRALTYIMVGHIRHHLNILKERYLA